MGAHLQKPRCEWRPLGVGSAAGPGKHCHSLVFPWTRACSLYDAWRWYQGLEKRMTSGGWGKWEGIIEKEVQEEKECLEQEDLCL